MEIRQARSATRHRISRDLSDPRLVFLGADEHGELLEVMAIKTDDDGLLIIHAQSIRGRYLKLLKGGL